MTISYKDLLKTVSPMCELGKKPTIPFTAAYAISKNITAIDGALKEYEGKKNALTKEFAKKIKTCSHSPKKLESDYKESLKKLDYAQTEVEIEPIPIKALERIDLAPFDVLAIAFMLTE